MKGRLLKASAFICAFLFLATSSAFGQVRPEQGTLYLTPQVGLAAYYGDLEGDYLPKFDPEFPYYLGIEAGYQATPNLAIGISYANVNLTGSYPPAVLKDDLGDESDRNLGNLLLRYTFAPQSTVTPFFELGAALLTGRPDVYQDRNGTGYGPMVGLGLDFALSDRLYLLLGVRTNFIFPDDAVDGIEEDNFDDFAQFYATRYGQEAWEGYDAPEDGGASWDNVSALPYLGFKFNFESAIVPVSLTSIECPDELLVGETGTFAASVSADATGPITYSWEFGDGATGSGMTTSHAFDSEGNFTATVTASDGTTSDTRSCSVDVEAAPVGAEIITVTADRMAFDICEPVTVSFSANVTGDQPITYQWDFGDGTQAMGSNVTHVFDEAGNFNVTLTASNEYGSDTESLTIRAAECETGICFEIEEMNCVYFERNSSTLTAEGRAALEENVEIFEECPNLGGRIEGWAAPGERNAQELSEDRARAVEQFYIDNGLAASRFTVVGMGTVTGVTSKKEGTSQYRRACTIPMQM